MTRVLLLGPTGMLGNAVYAALKDKYPLVLAGRSPKKLELLEKAHGGTGRHAFVSFDAEPIFKDFLDKRGSSSPYLNDFWNKVGDIDYAINAIGLTVAASAKDPARALFVNGALPHILARRLGPKLINITTDCAFDGRAGQPYDETASPSPVDIYGLSKTMGEPRECLNLRTSLVGRELESASGLLEWFLSQDGQTINGFENQFWSGLTTKQYGRVCDQIMSQPEIFPKTGTYHIFGTAHSKHELLQKFQQKYKTGHKIIPVAEPRINRTLGTIHDFNNKLNIPSFDAMLNEL